MTSADCYDIHPRRVPITDLARIYRVTPQALRKAAVKLQMRLAFFENPDAIRSVMIEDNYSRGKLRKMVFDDAEVARIHAEVAEIRYSTHAS